jgi:hypothetical protein
VIVAEFSGPEGVLVGAAPSSQERDFGRGAEARAGRWVMVQSNGFVMALCDRPPARGQAEPALLGRAGEEAGYRASWTQLDDKDSLHSNGIAMRHAGPLTGFMARAA